MTDINATRTPLYPSAASMVFGAHTAQAVPPEQDPLPKNPKTVVVYLGTREDVWLWNAYKYGSEVGAKELFFIPPDTKDLSQIEKRIRHYADELRKQGVLGPDERLDEIILNFHGSPQVLYIGGFENNQVVNIGAFTPLATLAKHINFTGCNVGADMIPESEDRSAVQLKMSVLPYLRFGTAVTVNSTYGLGGYGAMIPTSTAADDISPRLGPIDRAAYINGGCDNINALIDAYGPGGNAYRFVPVDKNADGVYGAGEYTVHRVRRNGDRASDSGGENNTGRLELYSTQGLQNIYEQFKGPDINELELAYNRIVMPEATPDNGWTNTDDFHHVWARFRQAVAEGLSYTHPKCMDVIASLAAYKESDIDGYEAMRKIYNKNQDDGYFAIIDNVHRQIYIEGRKVLSEQAARVPERLVTLMSDPVIPGAL